MNLLTAIATYREDDNTVCSSQECCFVYTADTGRTIVPLSLSVIAWVALSVKM